MSGPTTSDAERALRDFEVRIRSMRAQDMDLAAIESEVRVLVEARGRELMAAAFGQADTSASEVFIDGVRYGNRRVARGEYHTMFGVIARDRSTYQRPGGGRVAVPLDLRLGIVEGRYTPKMARVMTRAIAITTEHEGAEFLAELGTAVVSSSTLNRVPRAIAARYETRRDIVELAVREREVIPDAAVTMQVSLDGVMVPQDGEHARPRGRKTDSPDPPRHERRYGTVGTSAPAANDGHAGRAWHEASVGTVAFFDAEGVRLKTIYMARMPEPHKVTLLEQLEAEVCAALVERPTMNIVFASDGAVAHWSALEAMKERVEGMCRGHIAFLVDAFHVAQYVQKGADAIEGTGTAEASVISATWRETIKEKVNGADVVLRSMRARRSALTGSAAADLDAAIGYIANQHRLGRMAYAEGRERKYPIGTGITEAAAKTIVGTRMKRAGARFSQHGGQTVLLFRAALFSDRFDALHAELHSTYASFVKDAA